MISTLFEGSAAIEPFSDAFHSKCMAPLRWPCPMKVNAYGRELEILKKGGSWRVFDLGNEGKKRPASDIAISPAVDANQFSEYLSDLLHEYASQRNPEVTSTE